MKRVRLTLTNRFGLINPETKRREYHGPGDRTYPAWVAAALGFVVPPDAATPPSPTPPPSPTDLPSPDVGEPVAPDAADAMHDAPPADPPREAATDGDLAFLTPAARAALATAGYATLADLATVDLTDLHAIPGVGDGTIAALEARLAGGDE